MSRDSSFTQLHMHSSRHADLFEEFCRPPSAQAPTTTTTNGNSTVNNNNTTNSTAADPAMTQLPGHFLPFEEIHLPPHLMPLNPEDEDDVVPDMHAAFAIDRALRQGEGSGTGVTGEEGAPGAASQREPVWRDLGLERLVDGAPAQVAGISGARREGKKTSVLLLR